MTGRRTAKWAVIDKDLQESWTNPEHPIAVVEAQAITLGIFDVIAKDPQLHGRSATWYVDNVNALACMIKGNSGCK